MPWYLLMRYEALTGEGSPMRERLGLLFVRAVAGPKGLRDSAQGFNPGNHRVRDCPEAFDALSLAHVGGREITMRLMGGIYACDLEPLQGLFAGETRFPGLKPWAKSYSPFGAQAAGTTLKS